MNERSLRPLRICYFGTYRANYSRNQIMIAGLRKAGVEVIECHTTLWHGIEDRVDVAVGGWANPRFWWRVLRAYLHLLRRYKQVGLYDVMVVGYPGVLDVFLARIICNLQRKPLVWDVFMSVYLIALERGLDKKSKISVKLLRVLERQALRIPNQLIQDTAEYVTWFQKTYGIPRDRFRLVPTGADDTIFMPATQVTSEDDLFRIVYYGTFIPNHGVVTIIEAANLLKHENAIWFELIGSGPEREKALKLTAQYGLTNIKFVEWLDKKDLIAHIGRAQVCLGAFGTTPQSLMTIQNKIYEAMAMRKPLISGDSPAVRETFVSGTEILLCKREDGASLAEAIMKLQQNPDLRERLAKNSYLRFKDEFGQAAIGQRYAKHLREIVG